MRFEIMYMVQVGNIAARYRCVRNRNVLKIKTNPSLIDS